MKKTDIALIIIIISISAGIAYWVANATIGQSNDKPIVVRTAEPIQVDNITVDESVFSKDAINPTVETTISGEDLTSFANTQAETPTEGDGSSDTETQEGTDTSGQATDGTSTSEDGASTSETPASTDDSTLPSGG